MRRALSLAGGWLAFLPWFLWELIQANLAVASYVVRPQLRMRPGVVRVPLDVRGDARIVLLANLITLTPGSLTLDVSQDRRALYLHVMHMEDPATVRRSVKERFEWWVMRVTS